MAETALVTGGEGDLGSAIAMSLRESGLRVLAPGKEELNVRDSDCVQRYLSDAEGVDLLVCNAGLVMDRPLAKMSEIEWDQVMAVNLRGAFYCAREVSKGMIKRRCGHIILVASFSALSPPVGQANYAAAKSSLLGMMKSMAQELGQRNVRVNAILPGFLETKMTQGLSPEVKEVALSRHVLGRFNTPEAVAQFIGFLHQNMPHTSGQVFNLDNRILS